ncbi:MAG: D-3-phosphoglycerate dehydrogenase / 2-oxoglutarate reductase [Chloroflexota bacterium]|nr:D-3-phosphoglycerate dehydrogenase / 2-oxoglutarate reductase [Chloroflexota bacterium]
MRILVASPIDADALDELRTRHDVVAAFGAPEDELRRLAVDREAIVFRSGVSISSEVLAAATGLRLLVRAGSGLDNLDLDQVRRRGIDLRRVPGPGAQAVAELTFGLMLSLARGIALGDRLLREGHWAKSELVGYNLTGKTLGIVGLGSIGSRVASLGSAWGMRPIGCVDAPSPARAAEFGARGIELTDLDSVLAAADFLTIHVPLDADTRGMIGAAELSRVKPGAFLVNVARGGVVDEAALFNELQPGGRIRGAGLDVHVNEGEGKVSPLASLPNVVLTPHIGATTVDAQREIGQEVVAIVDGAAAIREESVMGHAAAERA